MPEKEILINGVPVIAPYSESIAGYYNKHWKKRQGVDGIMIGAGASFLIDPTSNPIRFGTKAFTWPEGTDKSEHQAPAASSYTWTVPTGKVWRLLAAFCIFTSSAVAGNRFLVLDHMRGGQVLTRCMPANVQAASLSYAYSFNGGMASGGPYGTNQMIVGLPSEMVLKAGDTLKLWDAATVDAGDRPIADIHYLEEDA